MSVFGSAKVASKAKTRWFTLQNFRAAGIRKSFVRRDFNENFWNPTSVAMFQSLTSFRSYKLDVQRVRDTLIILSFGVYVRRWGTGARYGPQIQSHVHYPRCRPMWQIISVMRQRWIRMRQNTSDIRTLRGEDGEIKGSLMELFSFRGAGSFEESFRPKYPRIPLCSSCCNCSVASGRK